jgi:hypothetical protein
VMRQSGPGVGAVGRRRRARRSRLWTASEFAPEILPHPDPIPLGGGQLRPQPAIIHRDP